MNTMHYVLIIFAISTSIALFIWISSKGVTRKDNDLTVPLAGLLACPSNKPFLLIRKIFRQEFLQLCRYKFDGSSYGIRLAFPIKKWSERYEKRLIEQLKRGGLTYQVCSEPDGHFIMVDFGNNLEAAQTCSQSILRNVFGFPEDAVYRVHLEP